MTFFSNENSSRESKHTPAVSEVVGGRQDELGAAYHAAISALEPMLPKPVSTTNTAEINPTTPKTTVQPSTEAPVISLLNTDPLTNARSSVDEAYKEAA